MEKTDKDYRVRRSEGRVWIPLGFIFIGGALFLRQMNTGLPDWLFSWQVLLISIGIFLGLSRAFRGPGWLILIAVGSIFLMDQIIPGIDLHRFLWPAVIIIVGLTLLIRPRHTNWVDDDWGGCRNRRRGRWRQRFENRSGPAAGSGPAGTVDALKDSAPHAGFESRSFSSEDFISATSILGGIHKNIVSKNFKGGDITIFMGGAEINLSQADIQGTAALEITQIMGGTKIIVPPHWTIRSELTSVLGSIEDKRQNISNSNPEKVLIIDGSSVMGGIEIRNF